MGHCEKCRYCIKLVNYRQILVAISPRVKEIFAISAKLYIKRNNKDF